MTESSVSLPALLFADGRPRLPAECAGQPDQALAWAELIGRHGPTAAAAQVQGDFAIALRLADGSVFMAVDRFATRSLCWRVDAAGLRCAGRADVLADRDAADSAPLATQAVFDYLYFHTIPSPRTVFSQVHRLPPGHCALYKDGAVKVTPYWRPHFEPARQPSFDALRAEFRGLLRDAVARQYDGSVPACFLSGGTDSSTVAGMLAEVAPRKPICYSIGFEADGYDEMAYARIAAKRFGCEHREIYFTPEDLVREIPRVAAAYDQPFGNSSALPSFHAAMQARADGVTRMLAGDGGDELFGGNARYAGLRLFEPWQRLPRPLRDALLTPLFSAPAMARIPLLRKGASYVRQANTPMPERVQDYNLIRRVGYERLFTPAFLAAVNTGDVVTQQRDVWAGADGGDEVDHHLAFDWRYTLAECDLPKVVGTTTLAGVSVGFPMLDDALLAFSMRLPSDYKLRRGALRWFFKEALRGYLPEEIIDKKKQGFGLPFGVWMAQHPALNQMARDALQGTVQRGLLRANFVHEFFDQLLPEHPHYYGTIAWIFLMLEHWMRAHAPGWRIEPSS
jgi:asparagine synthase (glutamine-hydrolysing)